MPMRTPTVLRHQEAQIRRLRIEATQTCAKTATTHKMSQKRKHTNPRRREQRQQNATTKRTHAKHTDHAARRTRRLRTNRLQSRTSSNPSKTGLGSCERSEGVAGVLTLNVGGEAQTCHDDRVVELKEQLVVEEVDGEGQEGKVKEEG